MDRYTLIVPHIAALHIHLICSHAAHCCVVQILCAHCRTTHSRHSLAGNIVVSGRIALQHMGHEVSHSVQYGLMYLLPRYPVQRIAFDVIRWRQRKYTNTRIQNANTKQGRQRVGLSHYLVDPRPRALFVHLLRSIYSDHLLRNKNSDLLKPKCLRINFSWRLSDLAFQKI